ncbi:MAG: fasciclin domain-containing protein [Pseudomonadota bacterium]
MRGLTGKNCLILGAIFLVACGGGSSSGDDPLSNDLARPENVIELAGTDSELSTFLAAVQAAGLDGALTDDRGRFTVFAPSNAAFDALGPAALNALLADTAGLINTLLYHVVSSEIDSTAAIAAAGSQVDVLNGQQVGISFVDNTLRVNLSVVTGADMVADNGIIHVIDRVLVPPAENTNPAESIVDIASASTEFTTLVAALQATGLDTVLADSGGEFTVFAPTNTAFAALGQDSIDGLLANPDILREILLQHVVAGSVNSVEAFSLNGVEVDTLAENDVLVSIDAANLRYGDATVTAVDTFASNGLIHVIDGVIGGDVTIPPPDPSIIDVATDAGDFTILLAALEVAGLTATLDDLAETYTVFAPSDAAFNALGADTINALLADPDTLRDILMYHVLSGEVLADAAIGIAASQQNIVGAANGDELALSLSGVDLYINLSRVSATDVRAANGVIHVLDKVLIPPAENTHSSMNIVETAAADGRFTRLLAALDAANFTHALADEHQTFTVFAPTDDAFAKIPADTLNALLHRPRIIGRLLDQHIIPGAAVGSVAAFSLNGATVDTGGHDPVDINIVDGELLIQGSKVVIFDIFTSNGVIHAIDTVITDTLH